MGLPWVRLDTQFASNPKVLQLATAGKWRSVCVYLASLCYAGAHGTDGYIPETALQFIHGTKQVAVDLVKVGLWIEDVGGFSVNDYSEFQITDEAARQRSDKARKAALSRWHGSDE